MSYFPMMINLEGRKVLVVGGGREGTGKAEILRCFGADIAVISPVVSDKIRTLANTLSERRFEDSDIMNQDYALVVAATDDPNTNRRISELCKEKKIPVNVVDNPPLCTFIFPAIVKDREVVCAVSSGGKSPYIAQYIKGLIRGVLPQNIGEINDRMGEIRTRAKKEIPDPAKRRRYLRKKLDEML